MAKKDEERKKIHKDHMKRKNNCNSNSRCLKQHYNTGGIDKNELLNSLSQLRCMISAWISKYYKGLFSIEYKEDLEIQKILNYWLYKFISQDSAGLLKIGDKLFVVKYTVSLRDSSYNPISVIVTGRKDDGNEINITINKNNNLNLKKEDLYKNIAFLEMYENEGIQCYGNPLKILMVNLYGALLKKVGLSNLATILVVDPENYVNTINQISELAYSDDGLIAYVQGDTTTEFREIKLGSSNASDVKAHLDNLVINWNLIKQLYSMRQNENFLSDRNISLGLQQSEIVYSFFEKGIEEAIQNGLNKVIKDFELEGVPILKKHIEAKISNVKVGDNNE